LPHLAHLETQLLLLLPLRFGLGILRLEVQLLEPSLFQSLQQPEQSLVQLPEKQEHLELQGIQ
jgi:hypothetical protein